MQNTIMITKKDLEAYVAITAEIEAIKEEIRSLEVTTRTVQYLPIAPQHNGETSNPTERSAIRITDLKERLQSKADHLLRLREAIEEWLEAISDPEIKAIVRWHYILRKSWKTTNTKVYGYPDYSYSRKRVDRYFEKYA